MGYNMKGWSGYQNSPMKQTDSTSNKPATRQEKLDTYAGKLGILDEKLFNEEITQVEYDKAVKALESTRVKGGKGTVIKDPTKELVNRWKIAD